MLSRVDPVYTGCYNRDTFTPALEGTPMRGAIDAPGQAAGNSKACRHGLGSQCTCGTQARGTGPAASDHGQLWPAQDVEITPGVEQGGGS